MVVVQAYQRAVPWECWIESAPIAAIVAVTDDGSRHFWCNARLVTEDRWAQLDDWAASQDSAPYALLPESALD